MAATTPLESLRETFGSASDVRARNIASLFGEIIHWEECGLHSAILARTAEDGTTELCVLTDPMPRGPYQNWRDVHAALSELRLNIAMLGWTSVDRALCLFEETGADVPLAHSGCTVVWRLDVLKYIGHLTRKELLQALSHPDKTAREHAIKLLEEFDHEKMKKTPTAKSAPPRFV